MEYDVRFTTHDEMARAPEAQEMRRRLNDPHEREQVRVEQRALMPEQYPCLARVLLLDAEKEAALLDLLTEHQLEHLD
jgi:hypothetical protein